MRLDKFVSIKYNFSRTKSASMIADGFVVVNGKCTTKPSADVDENSVVEITGQYKFASRGGDKLEKALNDFSFCVKDCVCADIGASNGGFTDCLLYHGAKKVFAVDVGECAFDDDLKNNPKVVIKDRTNARYIKPEDMGELCDFACIDVSFISLKLVLPAVSSLIKQNGNIIALIKPQFEAGKKFLTKTGIVNSEKVRKEIVEDIKAFSASIGLACLDTTNAPIRENKNIEYLILLKK